MMLLYAMICNASSPKRNEVQRQRVFPRVNIRLNHLDHLDPSGRFLASASSAAPKENASTQAQGRGGRSSVHLFVELASKK